MNSSYIKIISFCIALCSIAGGTSLASTLGGNYNSQERLSYDDELQANEPFQDSNTPSSDLIELSNSNPTADLSELSSDGLTGVSIVDAGEGQLETGAEENSAPLQYVSQSKSKAPIYEIIVGDF